MILAIFNCGPFVFRENRKFRQKLQDLQDCLVNDAKTYGYESHLSHTIIVGQKRTRSHKDHRGLGLRAEMHHSLAVDFRSIKKYTEIVHKERRLVH